MDLAQTLYDRSPVLIQHLMTTARGLQLRRLRYQPYTWRKLAFFMESQYWTPVQFADYQLHRLRELVAHALRHSPYYSERYGALKLDARMLRNLADLPALPIISKEEFRQHNDAFVSTHIERQHMWVSYTSGTTGTPLTAYHTSRNVQERIAGMERLYQWYLPQRWRKRASFTGKLIVNPDKAGRPFYRANLALRQQLYSSHHLTTANLAGYIADLKAFQPDQIDGIASPIYVVAEFLLRTGEAGTLHPKVVIPTSETIWPYIRERMEQGFACPVANQYGSQEGAPLAYECPAGGFHICPETGLFEILRPDGSCCPPGEIGQLVVTSFMSEGTPLIRYAIGDLASWRANPCPCGRHMPLLEGIEGRVDDMFFTRERGIVPRVDSAFKSMPSAIIATQVAQVALDRFEVRVIPDPAQYQPEHGASLVEHLHDYLGRTVIIDLKVVADIPRTKGGKLCVMVNECQDREVRMAILSEWNAANLAGDSVRKA